MKDLSYIGEWTTRLTPSSRITLDSAVSVVNKNWEHGKKVTLSTDLNRNFVNLRISNKAVSKDRPHVRSLTRVLRHKVPYFSKSMVRLLNKRYFRRHLHASLRKAIESYPSRRGASGPIERTIDRLNLQGTVPCEPIYFFPLSARHEVYDALLLRKLNERMEVDALAYLSKIDVKRVEETLA